MVLEILRQHPFRAKILRNTPRFILCSLEVIENGIKFSFHIETIKPERQFISFWPVLSYAARLSTPPRPVYLFMLYLTRLCPLAKAWGA